MMIGLIILCVVGILYLIGVWWWNGPFKRKYGTIPSYIKRSMVISAVCLVGHFFLFEIVYLVR